MLSRKLLALSFLTFSLAGLLSSIPSYGRRSVGTRASSDYGVAGGQAQWEWTPVQQSTVNGVAVKTETVCPGADKSVTPPVCGGSGFVFLYQVLSTPTRPAPNNLVITFSGLSRFAFDDTGSNSQGFGVLSCSLDSITNLPDPTNNMLCTDLTQQQVSSLNIGWDAIGGDLILTVPSAPVGHTLTFFILESPGPTDAGPLVAPTMSVGGAVIVPPNLTFGSQDSGAISAPQTVTIANSADFSTPLTITNVSKPTNFASFGGCTALNPGANCALLLSLSPTSTGAISEALNLTDDSPITTEVVGLSGTGTAGGVTLSPSNLTFGTQPVGTNSSPLSVTISNAKSNPQPLQVGAFNVTPNPVTGLPDFAQTNTCSAAISPGSSCTAQITFAPTISGLIESSITMTDNSSDGSHTIELSGNGTEVSTATASPSSMDFGTQSAGSTSAAQTVTITNTGTTSLKPVAVNSTAGFTLVSDKCSTAGALTAAAKCTVSLAFQPTVGAPYTGTLTIADDAPGGTLVIPLTGIGLATPAATPTFSPGAGTYSSIQTVTISDATPGAAIYYTTDGTTPTASSTLYSGPITVSSTQTIKAIATASGYATSSVASSVYTINLPPPSFTISGTADTVSAGAITGNTCTVTVTPAGGFTGSVTLTAAIASSPANTVNAPTLSFGSTSVVSITGTNAASATLTIATSASTVSAVPTPKLRGNGWLAAGGASLAFAFLFGFPLRNRKWRLLLGLLLLLAAVSNGMVACGGGGGNTTTSHGSPGTTPGSYTISISGVSGSLTETGTVSLTVK